MLLQNLKESKARTRGGKEIYRLVPIVTKLEKRVEEIFFDHELAVAGVVFPVTVDSNHVVDVILKMQKKPKTKTAHDAPFRTRQRRAFVEIFLPQRFKNFDKKA